MKRLARYEVVCLFQWSHINVHVFQNETRLADCEPQLDVSYFFLHENGLTFLHSIFSMMSPSVRFNDILSFFNRIEYTFQIPWAEDKRVVND